MGKGSKPTIGFWYSMTMQCGLCLPVDAYLQLKAGDRTAWSGNVTESGTVYVNAPELFGGEKKEGGIDGLLDILMGEADQVPNAKLLALRGSPQSAYRGLLTLVFDGRVAALNPYIKPWSHKVRAIQTWIAPLWLPELVSIDTGGGGRGMNPAHMVYRLCVERLGWDPDARLDLTRMQAAAQTLYDEGMGLCLKWTRDVGVNEFIATVCNHVGGSFVEDPSTGKYFLRLFRADYDIDDLRVIDESNIIELKNYEQAALQGSVNQVSVTWHNSLTNKDASVTAQNLANAIAQGTTVAKSVSYTGFPNHDLAARAAERDCRSLSALLASGEARIQRGDTDILRGDVLAFSFSFGGNRVEHMPVRVLKVDDGSPSDSAITIKFAQDIFGFPATSYVALQPSGWTEPDNAPQVIAQQRLIEASYRDLATRLGAADRAALDADAGFIGALAARPQGVAYDYTLLTQVDGAAAYSDVGTGDFAPQGLLQDDMPAAAGPTAIVVTGGVDLTQIEVGTEALIDDELCRVDAIDPQTGAVTLGRGCVDTVPAAHVATARIWFTDHFTGVDPTEYITGEHVRAKLLTRTGLGELDMSLAIVANISLDQRQARPYPPGNLKINGQRYPATTTAGVALTWSDRNRITQADQLIDTLQGAIARESGATYTVRVYLDGTLDSTTDAITAQTLTPPVSGYGVVKIEIDCVRAGLVSHQSLTAVFAYNSGVCACLALLTETGDFLITEAGDHLQGYANG